MSEPVDSGQGGLALILRLSKTPAQRLEVLLMSALVDFKHGFITLGGRLHFAARILAPIDYAALGFTGGSSESFRRIGW